MIKGNECTVSGDYDSGGCSIERRKSVLQARALGLTWTSRRSVGFDRSGADSFATSLQVKLLLARHCNISPAMELRKTYLSDILLFRQSLPGIRRPHTTDSMFSRDRKCC